MSTDEKRRLENIGDSLHYSTGANGAMVRSRTTGRHRCWTPSCS